MLHVLPHPGGGGETYVRALSGIEGYRAQRIVLAEVPWRLRGHDLLHVHGEVAAGFCLPLLGFRPSVVTLHGLHLLRRLAGLPRSIAVANLRLILAAAGRTICVSQAEQADLLQTLGAEATQRAVVILNGVEPSAPVDAAQKAAVRAELGISAETVLAVYVGALTEVKDPLCLAQAARQVSGLTLLMIGDGPLRDRIESIGQDSVRLLGQRDDVKRLLTAADVFVLPSKREGLSFALVEAMSLGLPAVVSDAPGNPEAVGDAGIVVRVGDVSGLAGALARLRDDASYRAELSASARARALKVFNSERMLRETRAVYEAVLREYAR